MSSDHSKFSFSFGDDAGGEDDANGSMFSFGFGDAGNDNNMSFMNGNNGAADALVNISLRSAGTCLASTVELAGFDVGVRCYLDYWFTAQHSLLTALVGSLHSKSRNFLR